MSYDRLHTLVDVPPYDTERNRGKMNEILNVTTALGSIGVLALNMANLRAVPQLPQWFVKYQRWASWWLIGIAVGEIVLCSVWSDSQADWVTAVAFVGVLAVNVAILRALPKPERAVTELE